MRESSCQRILRKGELRHDFAADEMFLDDSFQDGGRATVIADVVLYSKYPRRSKTTTCCNYLMVFQLAETAVNAPY